MTAPVYLLDHPLDGVAAGAALMLDGAEGRHAVTVRRTRTGERVDVADGHGRVARCTVTGSSPSRLELAVQRIDTLPGRLPRLVLVQALAKGGRDELAIEMATELGVDTVVPWQANRSVVVWSGERGARAQRSWRSRVRAAAKQSRRASVPRVAEPVTTSGLVALVGQVHADEGLALVLHEAAELPLVAVPLPATGDPVDLLVVVGPEGGIADDELADLAEAGARPVRIGPEVLRSSSAGPAALAVLAARLDRWT